MTKRDDVYFDKAPCCRQLPGCRAVPSPFTRIIILTNDQDRHRYITQCEVCQAEYQIATLATDVSRGRREWVKGQVTHVYELRGLPTGSFTQIIKVIVSGARKNPGSREWALFGNALYKIGSELPQWPYWQPRWNFAIPEIRRKVEAIWQIEGQAEPPHVVFASHDPAHTILAAEVITPNDLATIKDWFAFLGKA